MIPAPSSGVGKRAVTVCRLLPLWIQGLRLRAQIPVPVGLRPERDFAPGEKLLPYTDGVTEARDEHGLFYPVGERAHLLKDPDAHRALESLRADIAQHTGGPPHDDAAMLLLRYHGHGGGTTVVDREEPLPGG